MALDNLRTSSAHSMPGARLARVAHPVSVDKQMTEVADRCMKARGGGTGAVFRGVRRSSRGPRRAIPGGEPVRSEKRMPWRWASSAWTRSASGSRRSSTYGSRDSLLGKLAMLPQLAEVAKFPPRRSVGSRRSGARDREQDSIWRSFPCRVLAGRPAGPISPSRASSRATRRRVRNVGMYRIQVIRPARAGDAWQRHKVGRRTGARWRSAARKMPVAIALGRRPRIDLRRLRAAPPTIDEFLFAGFFAPASPSARQGAVPPISNVPGKRRSCSEG